MARTLSTSEPVCFTDTIAYEFPLDDDEKELIITAHRWLNTYCQLIDSNAPAPQGTRYEAWATLSMVSMLSGYTGFPSPQTKSAVPTPPDFIQRIGALVDRLQAKPAGKEVASLMAHSIQ